jgi:hypothetical protein
MDKYIKQSVFRVFTALYFVVSLTWFIPTVLLAHTEGASFEEEKEGYSIDIGYKPEQLVAAEQIRFDFNLSTNETADPFTDVWVYIERDNEVYFSGGIHKAFFGPTGLTLILPEAGSYVVSARFQNDGVLVVETDFPIELGVAESTATDTRNTPVLLNTAAMLVSSLLLGICLGYLFRLYKKSEVKS